VWLEERSHNTNSASEFSCIAAFEDDLDQWLTSTIGNSIGIAEGISYNCSNKTIGPGFGCPFLERRFLQNIEAGVPDSFGQIMVINNSFLYISPTVALHDLYWDL
jgi:hypothetical protein